MSLENTPPENLGQIFFVGIGGLTLSDPEKTFLEKNSIGGVILFARNIESEDQIIKLTQEIHLLYANAGLPKPFVGIDMEGGRVHRLNKKTFKNFPDMASVANSSYSELKDLGCSLGTYLMEMGINLNFSPCLDVLTQNKNKLIGDRSFGQTAQKVIEAATPFIEGLKKSKIVFCGKHFPGHGNTTVDSHFDLPKDVTPLSILEKRELLPYIKLSTQLPMIMTAHILQMSLDDEHPITLSKSLDKLLKLCNYQGLVTTDDMDMKAVASYYEPVQAAIKALNSGCDIIMYCNEPASPRKVLTALQQGKHLKVSQLETKINKICQSKKILL